MEAAGGEAAVKQLLDMDKVGLRESEVIFVILMNGMEWFITITLE